MIYYLEDRRCEEATPKSSTIVPVTTTLMVFMNFRPYLCYTVWSVGKRETNRRAMLYVMAGLTFPIRILPQGTKGCLKDLLKRNILKRQTDKLLAWSWMIIISNCKWSSMLFFLLTSPSDHESWKSVKTAESQRQTFNKPRTFLQWSLTEWSLWRDSRELVNYQDS